MNRWVGVMVAGLTLGYGMQVQAAAAAQAARTLLRPAIAELATSRAAVLETMKAKGPFRRIRLAALDRSAFDGTRLSLPLFPDVELEAEKTDIGFTGIVGRSWTGRLPDGGSAAFILRGDRVAGSIATTRGTFQVLPLGDGLCAVVEKDLGDRGECGTGIVPPPEPDLVVQPPPVVNDRDQGPAAPSGPKRSLAGTGDAQLADTPTANRIRVLVAYTADARSLTSSVMGMTMQELIDLAVVESNQGYANSGVTLRIELACLYQTVFTESTAIENDVSRFRNNGDGFMDEVHTLRADYDADMCALIVDGTDPDWCGWAYGFDYTSYSNMFQASVYSCVTGNYTFAHEFGHTQGCRHDNDGTLTPFAYGHGFRNGNNWRTIMAVAGTSTAPRLNYWSNPNINSPVSPFTAMGTAINGSNFANDNRSALNAGDSTVVNHESTPAISSTPTGDTFDNDEVADKIVTTTLTVGTFTANSGSRVQFRAGGSGSISLGAGFWARAGSSFRARLASPLGDAPPSGAGDEPLAGDPGQQQLGESEEATR